MKVLIFGRNKEHIEQQVYEAGFDIVETNPEFVVSYGGDGTLMQAEYAYPGVPKIILKDSLICKKCSLLPNDEVLTKVIHNRYSFEELPKLELKVGDQTRLAINDIILHNKDARHAIRYTLSVNERQIGGVIIGDGVITATPFGSTAYYRSITDSFFEVGIGVAFNNSIEQADHMVLREESTIKITIIRGPGVVYADNQDGVIELQTGSEVCIKKSPQKAFLVIPR